MTEKDLMIKKDSLFREVMAEGGGFGDHGGEERLIS
jgi:hypothetical protein